MIRKLLAILAAALLSVGIFVFSVPSTATGVQAVCSPVWSTYARHDTFVTIYDRNFQRNALLEFTAVIQTSTACGPQARRSTTLQINDGTIFDARVTVWNPVMAFGVCSSAASAGATYSEVFVSRVTIQTRYSIPYMIADDPCWNHMTDGNPTYGSTFYSLLASDGLPYFEPSCGPYYDAAQNIVAGHACYAPPDVI